MRWGFSPIKKIEYTRKLFALVVHLAGKGQRKRRYKKLDLQNTISEMSELYSVSALNVCLQMPDSCYKELDYSV